MSNNNRVFYPIQQVGFAPDGTYNFTAAHGVSTAGLTTTFDLTQIFEWGQLAIYDTLEGLPNVEMTVTKSLDGYPLLYHLATPSAVYGTLVGRSVFKTTVGMSVFSDQLSSSSGTPIAEVVMSGMYISNLTYTFPVDGACTEAVTLVGNTKLWDNSLWYFSGQFLSNADKPLYGHVMARQNVVFAPSGSFSGDVNGQALALCTVLPTDIYGVTSSGLVPTDDSGAHITGITVSANLGRDQILELGRKGPYYRYANFPVEVTTEITAVDIFWDGISGTEAGGQNGAPAGYNLKPQSIRVYTQDGTFISCGTNNKLTSVSYAGGDATTGGNNNVTLTYRYTTYNDLTVKHPADPAVALRGGGAV